MAVAGGCGGGGESTKPGTGPVTPASVSQVNVVLGASSLFVNQTTQATATLRDANNVVLTGRTVVWSTSSAAIATVTPDGVVSAVAVGTASIVATSEGKTGTADVTVALVPVATVSVSLSATSLFVGQTSQATAIVRDANNGVLTGRAVVWSSSNNAVATVSAGGLVSAVSVGTTNITGSSGTVTSAPVVLLVDRLTLSVVPDTATVLVGGTAPFTVVARNGSGQQVTPPVVGWTSANPAVGTISSAGIATGVSPGTTVVTATGSAPGLTGVFIVKPNVCDNVAAVTEWKVNLEFLYSDDNTKEGIKVHAGHYGSFSSTLTVLGPSSGNKFDWYGPLVLGPDHLGAMNRPLTFLEEFDDHVNDPTTVASIFNDGPLAPPDGVNGFLLEVDLTTCTFVFRASPEVHTKIITTEHAVLVPPGGNEGTRTFFQNTYLGTVQKGITPLGAWRTLGMGDYSQIIESQPSYSVAAVIPNTVNAYIPSGLWGQVAFFNPLAPAPRPSTWDLYYRIVVSVP